jgi:FKBP-type peptidyl-prolyl cis-trans isomerase FklB
MLNKFFAVIIFATIVLASCTESKDPIEVVGGMSAPKDTIDKISYAIGNQIGTSFRGDSLDVNFEYIFKGMIDGFASDSGFFTKEESEQIIMDFQQSQNAKRMAIQEEQQKEQRENLLKLEELNKTQGKSFLEENKKKEGWKTLPSGVQYKVIKEGTGNKINPTDFVMVHLIGTFIDGTEFDNTYMRGQPMAIPVMQVPPGWSEALLLMREGAQWEVVIPSELAFGEKGFEPMIPGNAIIKLDMTIVEKMDPAKMGQQGGMPPGGGN